MGLESSVTYISDLNTAWPLGSDQRTTADDHLRYIKVALSNTFPNITGAVTSTHTELNLLDGATVTTAEINYLDLTTGAGTAEASKAVVLDGSANSTGINALTVTSLITTNLTLGGTAITATGAELNILDGVTATAAELNILDGVTSTAAELNILDGVTATAAELNYNDITAAGTAEASKALVLDGSKGITGITSLTGTTITGTTVNASTTLQIGGVSVTSTAAELNVLDGYTGSVTELNYLDTLHATGVTATEFDYLDGVTSNIQTQFNNKQPLDADLTAIAALANTDGNFIVGTGSTWTVESGSTARTSLGISGAAPGHLYLGEGTLGAVTYSTNTNLARGEHHYSSLTINSGVTLGCSSSVDGWLVLRCTGTVTINGTIDLDGKGGAGGATQTTTISKGNPGAAGFGGGSGGAGGSSDSSEEGGNGGASTLEISGLTVAGAVGIGGPNGNGPAGTATSSMMKKVIDTLSGMSIYRPYGAGGGSGGYRTTITGGAGGNGGGSVIIIANSITIGSSGVITCDGAAGTDSTSAVHGGGGGGGGGVVVLAAPSITNSGSVTVTGGAGGADNVSGGSGGAGGAGYFVTFTV